MALTDRTEIGTITILADGTLEVRTDRIIMDGADEVSRTYSRVVVGPDEDPIALPDRVRKAADAFWDASTIAAYVAEKAAQT